MLFVNYLINMNKNNILAAAIVIAAVFISAAVVYGVKVGSVETDSIEQLTVEKNGETFIVEQDDPITMTVITDKTCEACDTEEIEVWIKKQVAGTIAIQYLDYSSEKGRELFDIYEGFYFPFLLLGSEVEGLGNFTHLTHHVITKTGDRYLVDLEKIGMNIGKYVGVESYEKDDPNAPSISIPESSYDFGEVKLSGGKVERSFVIKNEGKSPLVFLGLNTSCGCTSAKVITSGGESPEYKMAGHGEPVKWRGELAPGEEGKIVVFYDPSVHPDLDGDVTRTISIKTNDPNIPDSKIKIFVHQSPS